MYYKLYYRLNNFSNRAVPWSEIKSASWTCLPHCRAAGMTLVRNLLSYPALSIAPVKNKPLDFYRAL